jgi:hypothetical protein
MKLVRAIGEENIMQMNNTRAKARGFLDKDKGNLPPLRSGQAFIPSLERLGFSAKFL